MAVRQALDPFAPMWALHGDSVRGYVASQVDVGDVISEATEAARELSKEVCWGKEASELRVL